MTYIPLENAHLRDRPSLVNYLKWLAKTLTNAATDMGRPPYHLTSALKRDIGQSDADHSAQKPAPHHDPTFRHPML